MQYRVWRILGGIWDVARGFQGLGLWVEGSFRVCALRVLAGFRLQGIVS